MLGAARIQALLEEALRRSPAEQTEIALVAHDSALTRFANSAIHQNVQETNAEVRVRAVVGTRAGVVVSNALEPDALARAAEAATALARLQPEQPDFAGLAEHAPLAPVDGFRESTAACGPGARAAAG
jgi:predicted Zn-dependent protease